MDEAILVVEESLRHQAAGETFNTPREHLIAAPGAYLATMRGGDHRQAAFGFKTYTVASGVFRFFVYLYSSESGELLALIEANRLGQLRTGAATGVAARYMARENASVVGVLGSGFQARTQLEAVCRVRNVATVRVHSPNAEHREGYAREMTERLGVRVDAVDTSGEAVEGADILVTITNSPTPVFDGRWLPPGVHVTGAGSANEYHRELDDAAIERASLLVVDDLAQAKIEGGDLMIPASQGLLLWERVRELWQVVGDAVPGRKDADDITVFKSLGMAMWDVASAKAVYDKAVAQGVGAPLGA